MKAGGRQPLAPAASGLQAKGGAKKRAASHCMLFIKELNCFLSNDVSYGTSDCGTGSPGPAD